jgi:hypothetical protein
MSEREQELKMPRWGTLILAFALFGGILLPAVSLIIETVGHLCAESFFDPIPTMWHVLLVAFVPLANLQVWLAVRQGSTERPLLLGLANALAIGISIFYTIVFLPVLPVAFVALIMFGLGALPMTPLLALISGFILRRELRRIAPASFALRWSGLAAGLALAFTIVVAVELPITLTRTGLQMAASASPDERARGLRRLRAVGNMDYLLRACYAQTGEATDLAGHLFSLKDTVTPEEAREIYYRLTGETFDTRIPPKRLSGQWQPEDTFDFDPDQGGTVIAGKVKGLTLAASRMDGSVDADAALGYIEWTLVFKNSSASQREARAQVQLPPGGVVSRLTLWVNGEEREAAFAGRTQTRQAYEQVVRQRRDPVLVTTAGRDRALVQAFPVPPNGGEMKIRFGISVPLVLENKAKGLLRLPYFLERNFGVPDELTHAVWLESKKPLQAESGNLQAEQPRFDLHALRGTYSDSELSGPKGAVRVARALEITEAWTRDYQKDSGKIIRQIIREREPPAASRIVFVVDTSIGLRPHVPEISAALRTLPQNIEVKLLLADGNAVYEEGTSQHAITGSVQSISRQLERLSFEGGADNVPALIRAWDLASEKPGGVIVWVHSPQPLLLYPVEELRQRWERRPEGATLYALQTGNGADRVEKELDGIGAVEEVARMDGLQADLERLFSQLAGNSKLIEFVRTSEKSLPPRDAPNVKETSAHLVRLWANDEVNRIIANREKDASEKAIQLAAQYQVVTPVSGAVVLETAEQYARNGLQPVDAGTVPTIPEPETVLLLAVVAAIFLWLFYRQRMMRREGASR